MSQPSKVVFKPVENMNPTEMMTEIIQLRNIYVRALELVQERSFLYLILHQHGITPIYMPGSNDDIEEGASL
jgi:hypothetical protein